VLAAVSVALVLAGGFHSLSLTALSIVSVVTLVMASLELVRSLYSFRVPEATTALKFPEPEASQERIALLVAAWKEEAVLYSTLARLTEQTHDNYHIVVIVRAGDPQNTKGEATRAAADFGGISVLEYTLPQGETPGKALQLNHGLKYLRNKGFTVVGVFDAEDDVAPELLVHVDTAFKQSGADIIQGGVQLMNHDDKWFSVHNVVEYAQWFTGVVNFQAEVAKFFPLGGNTVFIRYDLLEAAGGWENHLTEDCALGVKLSVERQVKVAAFYDPELVTKEETPATLSDLVNQRVRWYQGFFIEFRKGLWRKLPSMRQRLMALYILCSPVYQSFSTTMLFVTVPSFILFKAPVLLVLMMWTPVVPMILQWVLKGIVLYDFGKAYNRKIRIRDYMSLLFLHPLYQLVLNIAGTIAVIRELRGKREWFSTPHSNLHRKAEPIQGDTNVPALAADAV
jgi:cellulose synthase/poly-beta-1,6-N-acetylglucosamine synthase-like glycosyltransferase